MSFIPLYIFGVSSTLITVWFILSVIVALAIVSVLIGLYGVFIKAQKPGWMAIVPFYGGWQTAIVAGYSGWAGLLPLTGLIISIIYYAIAPGMIYSLVLFLLFVVFTCLVYAILFKEIAVKFGLAGKDLMYVCVLPFIGLPIIGFNRLEYHQQIDDSVVNYNPYSGDQPNADIDAAVPSGSVPEMVNPKKNSP
jgi:hypothetical protein